MIEREAAFLYPLEGRRSTMRLMLGDCIERMKEIDDGSVDLTVTSPPYDNLRTYNGNNALWGEHVWKAVIKDLYRVTKDGGVVVWVVGDATIKGSETGTSFKQALWAMECGFRLHDTMIWNKGNFTAVGALKTRYAPVFEYMFVWAKGRPSAFNPIKDRKNKHYGDTYHQTVRQADGTTKDGHGKGTKKIAEWGQRHNIWLLYPEQSNAKRCHPAQYPESLARDHILSWSNEGDTVFDPFLGSGTTGKMALLHGRKFIGIERDPEYFRVAIERISSPNVAKAGLSVGFIQAKLFSNIEETKDHLADPDCCMCEGRGFYKALCVGEYDEQEITVQCACKRKQNLSRFDV